jgi:hypothetical protein
MNIFNPMRERHAPALVRSLYRRLADCVIWVQEHRRELITALESVATVVLVWMIFSAIMRRLIAIERAVVSAASTGPALMDRMDKLASVQDAATTESFQLWRLLHNKLDHVGMAVSRTSDLVVDIWTNQ